jgi:hypothetical protein
MLDKQGQVKAFQILSSSGLVVPSSVTISLEAAAQAQTRADTISSLLLPGVTYPPTISSYTGELQGFSDQLNQASSAAKGLGGAISPYITPSTLLQMKLGWDCYIKGNEITPAPPFALVDGMGDAQTPQALLDAVCAVQTDDLSSAMNAVNAKVQAGGGIPLTNDEIQALKDAVDGVQISLVDVGTTGTTVSTSAAKISTSTSQATNAFENAISITLTDSLRTDPTMYPAISLIMPDGVLHALESD